jgi:hypothetical protein
VYITLGCLDTFFLFSLRYLLRIWPRKPLQKIWFEVWNGLLATAAGSTDRFRESHKSSREHTWTVLKNGAIPTWHTNASNKHASDQKCFDGHMKISSNLKKNLAHVKETQFFSSSYTFTIRTIETQRLH